MNPIDATLDEIEKIQHTTDEDSGRHGAATRPVSGLILAIVAAAVFLASLDMFIVNIAFPAIQTEFSGSGIESLSWVLNAYMIVFAALLMPLGRLADRVGRKRVFMLGLAVFCLSSLACALAWSVDSLVAFRVVQGVGAAMLMSTSLALLLDAYPPERWSVVIGVWAAAGGMAAAMGPPLGGLLVELSWRWVFAVNLPFALAAWVLGRRMLNESRDPGETRWPDPLGTTGLISGVAILCWALVKAPDFGWGSPETIGGLVLAGILLAATILRAARTPGDRIPTIELKMFRNRPFAWASATGLVFMVSFGAMLLAGVLFFTSVWGYPVIKAGLAFAPGPAMAAIFAIPGGRLGTRFGSGPVAALGCLLFAAGSAWWILFIGGTPAYLAENLPGQILTGIGVGLVLPNISAAVASTLQPGSLATGSAVLSAGRQVGAVLGVAVLVAILGDGPLDSVAEFRTAWIFTSAVSLLGVVTALLIGPAAKESE
jgi:EmrB/QacA subfamily drug resistance transporter